MIYGFWLPLWHLQTFLPPMCNCISSNFNLLFHQSLPVFFSQYFPSIISFKYLPVFSSSIYQYPPHHYISFPLMLTSIFSSKDTSILCFNAKYFYPCFSLQVYLIFFLQCLQVFFLPVITCNLPCMFANIFPMCTSIISFIATNIISSNAYQHFFPLMYLYFFTNVYGYFFQQPLSKKFSFNFYQYFFSNDYHYFFYNDYQYFASSF